jgi:molecular chaperone DnaK (HSP70)
MTERDKDKPILGIDIGATKICVCVMIKGEVKPIPM